MNRLPCLPSRCLNWIRMKSCIAFVFALSPLLSRADDVAAPSPFGIGSCHINNRSAADNARWIPQMEAIGLHSYRTPHTDWGAVESEPGKWSWDTLDKQMDYLTAHGMNFGGMLVGNRAGTRRTSPARCR